MKSLFIDYVCHICRVTFERRRNLHRHYIQVEKIPIEEASRGNPHYSFPNGLKIIDNKENAEVTMFYCPCCPELLEDLNGLGEHIEAKHKVSFNFVEYT